LAVSSDFANCGVGAQLELAAELLTRSQQAASEHPRKTQQFCGLLNAVRELQRREDCARGIRKLSPFVLSFLDDIPMRFLARNVAGEKRGRRVCSRECCSTHQIAMPGDRE